MQKMEIYLPDNFTQEQSEALNEIIASFLDKLDVSYTIIYHPTWDGVDNGEETEET